MIKCNKCDKTPNTNTQTVWKCTSCGKGYKINLDKIKMFQMKKEQNENTLLLKCKNCGNFMDNGNEQIIWVCSCGNNNIAKLKDFSNNNENKSLNYSNKKLREKAIVQIVLVFIIAGISFKAGMLFQEKTSKKDSLDQNITIETEFSKENLKYNEINNMTNNAVNEIKKKIDAINDETTFSEILEIKNLYNDLDVNEKNLIDCSKIDAKIKLTELENASVAATHYIKESLKDSTSLQLIKVSAIDDRNGKSGYYLVSIEYSATNSFGGRIEDTSFQTITTKFENPWYALSLLNGDYSSALECEPFLEYYLLNEQKPIKLDIEKIMYYLDENY